MKEHVVNGVDPLQSVEWTLYPEFRRLAGSLHGLGVTGLDVVWLCMEIGLVWTFCIGIARHILDRLSSFIWNWKKLHV